MRRLWGDVCGENVFRDKTDVVSSRTLAGLPQKESIIVLGKKKKEGGGSRFIETASPEPGVFVRDDGEGGGRHPRIDIKKTRGGKLGGSTRKRELGNGTDRQGDHLIQIEGESWGKSKRELTSSGHAITDQKREGMRGNTCGKRKRRWYNV